MAKVTIEIDDTLQDTVDQCILDLYDMILEYVADNPDADDICLHNDIDYNGAYNEMLDGHMPIYYNEIDDLYYLHGDDLDDAFKNAGLYGANDRPDDWKQIAILLYLGNQCVTWFNQLDMDMDAWRESGEPFEDFIEWNLPTTN